jgi:hypothetical protein
MTHNHNDDFFIHTAIAFILQLHYTPFGNVYTLLEISMYYFFVNYLQYNTTIEDFLNENCPFFEITPHT